MRVWGWIKIDRNNYRFGRAIHAKIRKVGKQNYAVVLEDYGFKGRFSHVSKGYERWIDAYKELTNLMKEISSRVRIMLGRDAD